VLYREHGGEVGLLDGNSSSDAPLFDMPRRYCTLGPPWKLRDLFKHLPRTARLQLLTVGNYQVVPGGMLSAEVFICS
jgi:hypothetical protein